MNKQQIHPWNAALWQKLTQSPSNLPHAILLQGIAGLGKMHFSRLMASWLLCQSPGPAQSCGRCRSCELFAVGNHPDLHILMPEFLAIDAVSDLRNGALRYLPDLLEKKDRKPKSVIVVDQVRELITQLSTHGHSGTTRVVILAPAELMNVNAANALLKVLEEPTEGSIFLLVSHQPAEVPITVRSRCMRADFAAPDRATILTWLRQSSYSEDDIESVLEWTGGAPLRTIELLSAGDWKRWKAALAAIAQMLLGNEDPVETARFCLKNAGENSFFCLQHELAMAIKCKLINDQAMERQWPVLDAFQLFRMQDVLITAKKLLAGPADLTLLLEQTLIDMLTITNE